MSTPETLSATLQAAIPVTKLFIKDFSNCGCGQKFELWVFSEQFDGVTRINRHKMVQEALKDEIAKIHAITLKLHTPDEYESKVDAMAQVEDLVEYPIISTETAA